MRLCIIGTGKMGSALAAGLAKGRAISPKDILLVDSSFQKAKESARAIGATPAKSANAAVRQSSLIIIAVKPNAVEDVLLQLGSSLEGKLLVSIAATIPFSFLESRTPKSCRVALAMPNIAMQAGAGMCCYVLGRRCSASDAKLLQKLLSSAGYAMRLKRDSEIDNVYISSSGIAFFFMAMESLARAAQQNGMRREQALKLASAAAYGAGAVALSSGKEPLELEKIVATKGGITAEGLRVLRKKRVPSAFLSAAKRCIAKARRIRKSR